MATNWADIAKSLAPVLSAGIGIFGVWIGAGLTRRSSAQSFLRERIFGEMTRRREVSVSYRRALWAFASRVNTMRDLADRAAEAKAQGDDDTSIRYDFNAARKLQQDLLFALAEIEAFSTMAVQLPARECYEALVACFNACAVLDTKNAAAKWAFYQQLHERFANEVNRESEQFNRIIYMNFTPVWRAILGRAQRKSVIHEAGVDVR